MQGLISSLSTIAGRAAALAGILTAAHMGSAAGAGGGPDLDFSLIYEAGRTTLRSDHDRGRSNGAALERIVRAFMAWPKTKTAQITFIANRDSVCAGVRDCDADSIMWARVSQVMAHVLEAAKRRGRKIHVRGVNFAFSNEIAGGVRLPESTKRLSAIHLRMMERAAPAGRGCPARLGFRHPDWPPGIRDDKRHSFLALEGGARLHPGVGFLLIRPNASGRPILSFWRDRRGWLKRAAREGAVPAHPATLYLVQRSGAPLIEKLAASLSDAFAPQKISLPFIGAHGGAGASAMDKGFGDHGSTLAEGTVMAGRTSGGSGSAAAKVTESGKGANSAKHPAGSGTNYTHCRFLFE